MPLKYFQKSIQITLSSALGFLLCCSYEFLPELQLLTSYVNWSSSPHNPTTHHHHSPHNPGTAFNSFHLPLEVALEGLAHGRVVKFMRSAAGGSGFHQFESWAWRWHRSSSHAEAASYMLELEGPTTKIYNYVSGCFGEKKEK